MAGGPGGEAGFGHRLVSDERRAVIEREQEAAGLKPESVWGSTTPEPVTEELELEVPCRQSAVTAGVGWSGRRP